MQLHCSIQCYTLHKIGEIENVASGKHQQLVWSFQVSVAIVYSWRIVLYSFQEELWAFLSWNLNYFGQAAKHSWTSWAHLCWLQCCCTVSLLFAHHTSRSRLPCIMNFCSQWNQESRNLFISKVFWFSLCQATVAQGYAWVCMAYVIVESREWVGLFQVAWTMSFVLRLSTVLSCHSQCLGWGTWIS